MKNKFCKVMMVSAVSFSLVLGMAMSGFAANPEDQWSEIPDGFTFETKPSGVPTVYATPNPAPESGAAQGSTGQSIASDDFDYTLEEFAALHLAETNKIREEYGLAPLMTDPVLTEMAQARMDENNGVMTHTRPDGSYYWTIFDEYDTELKANGENITSAGGTPASSARGFLETKHRENVLRPDSEYIGIGVEWVDTIIGPRIAVLQLFAKQPKGS